MAKALYHWLDCNVRSYISQAQDSGIDSVVGGQHAHGPNCGLRSKLCRIYETVS